jgi:phosphoribosylaminoimidazole-succinocarboxamide synthase
MSGKADFSVDEWDLLRSSPLMASLLVVAASPSGPVGLVQESTAAGKLVMQAAATAQTPLLKALAEDMVQTMAIPRPPAGATPAQVQEAAAEILRRTSALLATKATPEEASEIKDWLAKIAQATAEAAKEGGFLGIGGVLVSDQEKAATVHDALGLAAA